MYDHSKKQSDSGKTIHAILVFKAPKCEATLIISSNVLAEQFNRTLEIFCSSDQELLIENHLQETQSKPVWAGSEVAKLPLFFQGLPGDFVGNAHWCAR